MMNAIIIIGSSCIMRGCLHYNIQLDRSCTWSVLVDRYANRDAYIAFVYRNVCQRFRAHRNRGVERTLCSLLLLSIRLARYRTAGSHLSEQHVIVNEMYDLWRIIYANWYGVIIEIVWCSDKCFPRRNFNHVIWMIFDTYLHIEI